MYKASRWKSSILLGSSYKAGTNNVVVRLSVRGAT